jgi:hypothetical protein
MKSLLPLPLSFFRLPFCWLLSRIPLFLWRSRAFWDILHSGGLSFCPNISRCCIYEDLRTLVFLCASTYCLPEMLQWNFSFRRDPSSPFTSPPSLVEKQKISIFGSNFIGLYQHYYCYSNPTHNFTLVPTLLAADTITFPLSLQ